MKESDIQQEIMKAIFPLVAWAKVNTTGLFRGKGGGRFIQIGIPGEPDIIGQTRDGRLFGIEVKIPGKKPTQIQLDFIKLINDNNGLAGWATSPEEAVKILEG